MRRVLLILILTLLLSTKTHAQQISPEIESSIETQGEAIIEPKAENIVQIGDSVTVEEDIDKFFEEDSSKELQGGIQYTQVKDESEKNAVYLEEPGTPKNLMLEKPKVITTKALEAELKKPSFDPFSKELSTSASKFSAQEYAINPVSAAYSKKIGQFSFGTMYDSYLYSAQINYSTGVFAKYENKRFALSSAFSKNTDNSYDSYSDKFYLVPEFKLTKRLSLLNVMQSDVYQINKKTELVLRYKPNFGKYANDVQFELGAGQSFYNNQYVKSSLRFSTSFKL